MDKIKAAVMVFCVACVCAELIAQLTENGWARRGIKVIAGLYILLAAFHAIPQVKAEWRAGSVPAASSASLGTLEDAVLAQAGTQLEQTLEKRCLEELGLEVTLHITLEERSNGTAASHVTVTPHHACTLNERQKVEALLQEALAVSPEWILPGGEMPS